MRATTVTLARFQTSKESIEQFVASLSNRIDVVDMPESPGGNSMFEEKAPWWDLDQQKRYRYFEIDQLKEGSGNGKLKAYIVDASGTQIVYLCSHKR